MSSLPGYSLEAYLQWNYNIVVMDDEPDPSFSAAMAEMLGNRPFRPRVTPEQFSGVVEAFEGWREYIEDKLSDFDEESQSWRGYNGNTIGHVVPDSVWEAGALAVLELKKELKP